MSVSSRLVLTGPPGSGKTTLIEALQNNGFKTIAETALSVIESENNKEQPIFPWTNPALFQEKVMELQHHLESELNDGTYFLDRSIIDCITYCQYYNVPVKPEWKKWVQEHQRYDTVFFLEGLPTQIANVTRNGMPRRTTPEQREELGLELFKAYQKMGYEPISVPVLPIDERLEFVIEKLK